MSDKRVEHCYARMSGYLQTILDDNELTTEERVDLFEELSCRAEALAGEVRAELEPPAEEPPAEEPPAEEPPAEEPPAEEPPAEEPPAEEPPAEEPPAEEPPAEEPPAEEPLRYDDGGYVPPDPKVRS